MKLTHCMLAIAICVSVQAVAAQGQDFSRKGQYELVKGWVTKAAAMMPEPDYSFKPTPEVRSFGELLGHIANSTGMICTVPGGGKSPLTGDAEKLTSKAETMKALADTFAACDRSWAAMAPAWDTETVDFFGGKQTRVDVLLFNTSHTFEHYGNVVTYMRLRGLVPPSSGGGN